MSLKNLAENVAPRKGSETPERTFGVLKPVSSHTNEKLHLVARELVRRRHLSDRSAGHDG